jgi:hypothetical protein
MARRRGEAAAVVVKVAEAVAGRPEHGALGQQVKPAVGFEVAVRALPRDG